MSAGKPETVDTGIEAAMRRLTELKDGVGNCAREMSGRFDSVLKQVPKSETVAENKDYGDACALAMQIHAISDELNAHTSSMSHVIHNCDL